MMFIGTYTDEKIIKIIRESENPSLKKLNSHTDEQLKIMINQGFVSIGITHFFSDNIQEAKTMALNMDLKNFAAVSNRLYEKENNFK